VQRLASRPAGEVLGVERLRDEPPAARGELGDLSRARRASSSDRSVAAAPIHARNSSWATSNRRVGPDGLGGGVRSAR
jgi:hypothetical protein